MKPKYIELYSLKELQKEEKEYLQENYDQKQNLKDLIKKSVTGMVSSSAIRLLKEVADEIKRESELFHVFQNDKTTTDMVNPTLEYNFKY